MNKEDEHRAERQREKDEAVKAIERALSAIETDNHEPDQWERAFLVQAVSCLFRGAYRLAAVDAQLALTPPNTRSPASDLQPDTFLDRCNLSVLRAALREAVVEPVRDYPALGPIVFAR
jgi:hypothetical protein